MFKRKKDIERALKKPLISWNQMFFELSNLKLTTNTVNDANVDNLEQKFANLNTCDTATSNNHNVQVRKFDSGVIAINDVTNFYMEISK